MSESNGWIFGVRSCRSIEVCLNLHVTPRTLRGCAAWPPRELQSERQSHSHCIQRVSRRRASARVPSPIVARYEAGERSTAIAKHNDVARSTVITILRERSITAPQLVHVPDDVATPQRWTYGETRPLGSLRRQLRLVRWLRRRRLGVSLTRCQRYPAECSCVVKCAQEQADPNSRIGLRRSGVSCHARAVRERYSGHTRFSPP